MERTEQGMSPLLRAIGATRLSVELVVREGEFWADASLINAAEWITDIVMEAHV